MDRRFLFIIAGAAVLSSCGSSEPTQDINAEKRVEVARLQDEGKMMTDEQALRRRLDDKNNWNYTDNYLRDRKPLGPKDAFNEKIAEQKAKSAK